MIVVTLTTALASAQTPSELAPYLLRLEHGDAYSSSCVLLQKSGAYHLELEDTEKTRVFEGSMNPDELQQLVTKLRTFLAAVSQGQIEEPLIAHHELLKLDVPRSGRWAEVTFLSAESQEPYRQSLEPLIQWLNDLHKLPHKELTEDAGKNNCLVPTKIVLRNRSGDARFDAEAPIARPPSPTVPSQTPPAQAARPQPPPALLRVLQMAMKSGVAEQRCVLVTGDGAYRTEQRWQKEGTKKAGIKIDGGVMTPPEISELQQILADPALAKIHHHETSRAVLPMSGEMLELEISRPSGVQDVVLSSTFARGDVPFFYAGDGDISSASKLLEFLKDHVEANQMGALDPSLRNDCEEAP